MTLQDAKDSIRAYVEHGVPLGGFLEAVISNDLMQAMGRADLTSRANLFEICAHIYNEIPSGAHGSPKNYQAWLQRAAKARSAL